MLAKKLELKEISECKLKQPEIPTKIKAECEKYISTWNEKTFEEIVTIKDIHDEQLDKRIGKDFAEQHQIPLLFYFEKKRM